MKSALAVRTSLLSLFVVLALAGCSGEDKDMSKEDIQYLSHLDQSRFYQRQGELKASTQEARSAIELQPHKIEPYFLIVDNLLTAGDAVNAERQLKRLMETAPGQEHKSKITNRANLILAQAKLRQAKYDEALAALNEISEPSATDEAKSNVLRGQVHLAAGKPELAQAAFVKANSMTSGSIEALIGLSKLALAQGDETTARQRVVEAEELDRENADLWLWKAQLAHFEEEWEKAEDAYIRALEDIGQYDIMTARKYTTISALISVLRAQSKFSEAFVYEEILAKSPPGKIRSNLIAAEEALRNQELVKAECYLKEILAQAPGHEQTTLMLGLVRFRQGRAEEAHQLLEPIASKGDSEIASKMLAATMLQMGNPQGAQSTLAELENGDSDPETLTLVAIAALENGDTETGEALMEKALSINPDNHELRLRYASYLSQRGEHQRAITQVAQVRQDAPELDQARQVLIQVYVQAGDIKAAVQASESWMKEDEDSIQARILRGNLAVQAGESEQARQSFLKAQQEFPKSAAPSIALGQLALVQNDRAEAKTQFQRAVRLAPDNAKALQGLLTVQERDETERFMRTVLEDHPDATGPRLILLEIALLTNNTEEADQLTASLLERSDETTPAPSSEMVAGIYANAAANLRQTGETENSDTVLERAQVLFPDNERVNLLAARQAFDRGSIEAAQELLDNTRKQHPLSANPYLIEAEYLEREADYEKAAELYREALVKKSTPEIVTGYVRNLQRSGKAEEALTYLKQELDTTPDDLQLRLNLALLQQSTGQEQSAQANYETLLAAMPNNTVVLNNLAWLYHKNDDQRAVKLAERAYELSPDNAAIADTYGWIMLKAGNHRESVPVLEKAHELQPDSEEIARHLAEAYRIVGMTSAAQRILEKFGDQG